MERVCASRTPAEFASRWTANHPPPTLTTSIESSPLAWRATVILTLWLGFLLSAPVWAQAAPADVTVTITDDGIGSKISPLFLGLSYEMSLVLPRDGKYYFDANDKALVNTFHTLGIKSLRVGANAVDDPKDAVPQEKDIDPLFAFARAAGVKVIYSFRLKKGDPAVSARLAAYIAEHDADALDCFSIGNEPNAYDKTFEAYFADWKPHYDAVLKADPAAMFDGPSVFAGEKNLFPQKLANAMVPGGHMAMISDHYYVMGLGAAAEKNLPSARGHFLSNDTEVRFGKAFAGVGSKLMAKGIPYRIDELNNCFHGGAKGVSDTYTAALWALDASHWWAAHHILGLNYHTGEFHQPDGTLSAQNYSAFLHLPGGNGLEIRPESYGYLAFTQGAVGRPLKADVLSTSAPSLTAYAYRADDGSMFVTLINKTFAAKAKSLAVSLPLPAGITASGARRMDLAQKANNVAAQTDITLGGAGIDSQGVWAGQWNSTDFGSTQNPVIQVPPTSAIIVHFLASK
jgi:hypothetical protein